MNAFSSLASSSPSGSTVQSEPPLRQGPLGAIRSMFSDADGDIANGSSPAVESVSSSASNNKWNASGVKNMFTGGGKLSTDDSAPAVDEGGDNDGFFSALSYQERLMGFGACFIVGYVITFSSFSRFVHLLEGNPVPFVSIYSLGNILSLLSMGFLCGPSRQLRLVCCIRIETVIVK
mmetsp:Transcript_41560/g.97263  ORF Transcript_41560/g.97263 Transcript_41560/m.97263 type:complete len:177 (-) Transcript_41560:727-1257(-)